MARILRIQPNPCLNCGRGFSKATVGAKCCSISCHFALRRRVSVDRRAEYFAWFDMRRRCLNSSHKNFPSYGARGIAICSRWIESFDNFYADMGPRPPGMTLERVDNDGQYSPGNCKWDTQRAQRNNTRKNVFLTHEGRRATRSQWSAITGMATGTIRTRIASGWPADRALTQRPDQRRNWRKKPTEIKA